MPQIATKPCIKVKMLHLQPQLPTTMTAKKSYMCTTTTGGKPAKVQKVSYNTATPTIKTATERKIFKF